MKKSLLVIFTFLLCFSFFSCKKLEKTFGRVESSTAPKIEQKFVKSPLTGLDIDINALNTRPVAIMINNNKKSMPQMGLSNADIYFEIPAEGELNRIMPIFTDYKDVPVIGTIRSSRDYFLHYALPLDTIYIHFGGSPQAYSLFNENKIDHLDGMDYVTNRSLFWRDEKRRKEDGLEHSAMTSGEKIMATLAKNGIRTELSKEFVAPFIFNDKDKLAGDIVASEVNAYYSYYITGRFVYDSTTTLYNRFQFDVPHIDGNTNTQLSVKNIFILFTDVKVIAGDEKGRLDVRTTGKGSGYYISNGTAKSIEWSKENMNSKLFFLDSSGNEIKINRGKTWICILPDNLKSRTNIS